MTLDALNHLAASEAIQLLKTCACIDHWAQIVVSQRPFATTENFLQAAKMQMQYWQQTELDEALSGHPRIGEKKAGNSAEAKFSAQEQSASQTNDAVLKQAIAAGNLAYESKFDRIFLIRAKGRDSEAILAELNRRLQLTPEVEVQEALAQLREITLLRLEGMISE